MMTAFPKFWPRVLLFALFICGQSWAQPNAARLKRLWSLPHETPRSRPQEISATDEEAREAWVRYYGSGTARAIDDATALAMDAAGNVYVTGTSSNLIAGQDFLTIKYDASGNEVWSARYSGEEYEDDEAEALTLDAAGNVYVAGRSRVKKTSWDYATVKYDAFGVQQWAARYDGGFSGEDGVIALALDSSGNVYVTGYSFGARQNFDYATIKYDHDGNELWIARYDGPGDSKDVPVGLTLRDTNAGTLISVTGASGAKDGNSTRSYAYDYATVQYESDGRERWQARFDLGQFDDQASALAMDRHGNVYVTGAGGYRADSNSSMYSRYATVKYDIHGVEQWRARHPLGHEVDIYATALGLDQFENVYVTGAAFGACLTVKYDRDGKLLWASPYQADPSPRYGEFLWPNAMQVDAAGNAFITGYRDATSCDNNFCLEWYEYFTIKIDAGGDTQWTTRYVVRDKDGYSFAQALALDVAGNVSVTGASNADYMTIKYDANGVEQWQRRYTGSGRSDDKPRAFAVDQAGNTSVLGFSRTANGYADYLTLTYDREGNEKWRARFGDNAAYDASVALAHDDSGNVYVTGWSLVYDHKTDMVTIKYNSSGQQQWLARFNGAGNAEDSPVALDVDRFGNVYVTGSSKTGNTVYDHTDYATVKYNAAGAQQWVAIYNSATNTMDLPHAQAVDERGNVYVTGRNLLGAREDIVTVKYDAFGKQQWAKRYQRAVKPSGYPMALVVDQRGDVYITGYTENGNRRADYLTLKYSGSGEELWVAHYDGPGNAPYGESDDRAVALVLDAAGNAYLCGSSYASGSGLDIATIKYNHTGVAEWVARYNDPRNFSESAYDIALDTLGNAYVTGASSSQESHSDIVTLKYNSFGEQQWLARYAGILGGREYPKGLGLDRFANVYVVGRSETDSWSLLTTIKYVQAGTNAVIAEQSAAPAGYALAQNHPNPFNPSTTIRYALAKAGRVTLKIYNLAGQEVTTLVEGDKAAGEHEIKWTPANLASGVYLYRLHAGDFVETKKLVLLQ